MVMPLFHRLIILSSLLLGFMTTYFAYTLIQTQAVYKINNSFKEAAHLRVHAVEQSIKLNLAVLQAVKAFYDASKEVTRDEFDSFTSKLVDDDHTILSLKWVVKDVYENGLEQQAEAQLLASNKRDAYYRVLYSNPTLGNEETVSVDLGLDEYIFKALLLSEETGALSIAVPAAQNKQRETHFILPIYDGIDVQKEDKRTINGFVIMSTDFGILIDRVLDHLPAAGVHISVKENNQILGYHRSRAADSNSMTRHQAALTDKAKLVYQGSLFIGDKEWKIVAEGVNAMFYGRKNIFDSLLLISGIVISILVTLIIQIMLKRHTVVVQLVNEKTGELNQVNQQLLRQSKGLELEVENRTRELLKAKVAAESASLAKSEFLSSMSHELRTPLNSILGFAQLLEMESETPLTEHQQESVDFIVSAGEHLLKLINQVLDLSAIEAGMVELSIEDIILIDVINDASALMHVAAQKAYVQLNVMSDTDLSVRADYIKLKQVLLNLLSNAIKYNKSGGSVSIDWQVTEDDFIKISVIDTGIGIPEAKQHKVFSAFDRLGQESSNIDGTGIGLLMTKDLVELMDGRVGFDSIEGEGSTFWFELPVAEQSLS